MRVGSVNCCRIFPTFSSIKCCLSMMSPSGGGGGGGQVSSSSSDDDLYCRFLFFLSFSIMAYILRLPTFQNFIPKRKQEKKTNQLINAL